MVTRRRVALGIALAAIAVDGVIIALIRPFPPRVAYLLIEETTLIPLKGTVEVEHPGGGFNAVSSDAIVFVGDRIRTGPDAFAVVTYFDGSTTELEPSSTIQLTRLENLSGNGQSISLRQESGLTWHHLERMPAGSRFEVTTVAAVVSAGSSEFKMHVAQDGTTIVDAVTDKVTIETEVNGPTVQTVLAPGLRSIISRGQPPTSAVPSPPAALTLRIDFDGPLAPFITDVENRSVGLHPHADANSSQIPGATYSGGGGRQSLIVPSPSQSYAVTIKGVEEGPTTISAELLVAGQPTAQRPVGLNTELRESAAVQGSIRPGQLLQINLQVLPESLEVRFSSLRPLDGPPPGRVGITQRDIGSSSRYLAVSGVLVQDCRFTGDPEAPYQMLSLPTGGAANGRRDSRDVLPIDGACPSSVGRPSTAPTENVSDFRATASYSPVSGPVNSDFELTASGFTPGEEVSEAFSFPGSRAQLGASHVADPRGSIRFIVELDASSAPGLYESNLTGTRSGAQAIASFTVTQ